MLDAHRARENTRQFWLTELQGALDSLQKEVDDRSKKGYYNCNLELALSTSEHVELSNLVRGLGYTLTGLNTLGKTDITRELYTLSW